MRSHIYQPKNFIEGPSLSDHLVLSLVSNQVSKEALAVFYQSTDFIYRTFDDLQHSLAKTPEYKLHLVRHISFVVHPRDHRDAVDPFSKNISPTIKTLKTMKSLQTMNITVWDHEFSSVLLGRRNLYLQKWPDMLSVPAVIQLRSMRAMATLQLRPVDQADFYLGLKEVTVHGDCTNVKTILEAEMVLAKPSKVSTRGRKGTAAGAVKQSNTKMPSSFSNSTGSSTEDVDVGRSMSSAFPDDLEASNDEDTLFVSQCKSKAVERRSSKKSRRVETLDWSIPEQWSDEVTSLSYGMP